MYILVGTVFVYGLLVATHKGEFWPFSIYPMFSQAGHPWIRALVRDVPGDSTWSDWRTKTKAELPGKTFAMDEININQNDLANFIHKNKDWSAGQIRGLRKYFHGKLDHRQFLVFKVRGHYAAKDPDSVAIDYIPYIFIHKDTTIFNPQIFGGSSVKGDL